MRIHAPISLCWGTLDDSGLYRDSWAVQLLKAAIDVSEYPEFTYVCLCNLRQKMWTFHHILTCPSLCLLLTTQLYVYKPLSSTVPNVWHNNWVGDAARYNDIRLQYTRLDKTSFSLRIVVFILFACFAIVYVCLVMIHMSSLLHALNPYWTGRTYMSLPGKGLEGHICPTIVKPWWRHCNFN